MGKTLIKILTGIGALLGVGFVVLFCMEAFGVPIVQKIRDVGYGVYIVIAAAALCVALLVTAGVLAVRRKARLNRDKQAGQPLSDESAPAAVTDDVTMKMIPENAPFSPENMPEETQMQTFSSSKEDELLSKPEIAAETADFQDSRVLSDDEEPDFSDDMLICESTEDEGVYELPVPPAAATIKDQKVREWQDVSRLLDQELSDSDIAFTGKRIDDTLNLDQEFIVRSQDEAVLPKKQVRPSSSPEKQTVNEEKMKKILDMIREIEEMVDEEKGRENE